MTGRAGPRIADHLPIALAFAVGLVVAFGPLGVEPLGADWLRTWIPETIDHWQFVYVLPGLAIVAGVMAGAVGQPAAARKLLAPVSAGLIALSAGFLFVFMYEATVTVEFEDEPITYIIGFGDRPAQCAPYCPPELNLDDEKCAQERLSPSTKIIARCWGAKRIRRAKMTFWVALGLLGFCTGVVLGRRAAVYEARLRRARRHAPAPQPPAAAPVPAALPIVPPAAPAVEVPAAPVVAHVSVAMLNRLDAAITAAGHLDDGIWTAALANLPPTYRAALTKEKTDGANLKLALTSLNTTPRVDGQPLPFEVVLLTLQTTTVTVLRDLVHEVLATLQAPTAGSHESNPPA